MTARPPEARISPLYRALGDRLFAGAVLALCLLIIGIVVLIGWQLAANGSRAFAAFGLLGFLGEPPGTRWRMSSGPGLSSWAP